MEDIRDKMRARHSVAFATQKMPILAESNMQDVASMKAGETSVLMGDGMMDMSDLQETNVLAASTWIKFGIRKCLYDMWSKEGLDEISIWLFSCTYVIIKIIFK